MRVPFGVAAVSCLCPLVVFLCVVSQSCYGTQVSLSPHTNPKPSLYQNPRLKLLPEPTPIPSTSPDKYMTALKPSLHSSSSQNIWTKSQLKSRLNTISYHTDKHKSNSNFPSAIAKATSSSNTRLELEHAHRQSSDTRHGLANKSNSNHVERNTLNYPKKSSKLNTKNNPKPRLASLSQSKPKVGTNSKVITNMTNSEYNTKLPSLPSSNQRSNSSGTMNPSNYYNSNPALISSPKSHSKARPPLQANARSDSKNPNANSRISIRAPRNQTKLVDIDKDSHHRPKRGWVWNQFFVLEEHMGPEPQYVGKLHSNSDKGDGSVRYILSGEGAGSIFIIDETTGDIHATKSLDRERKSQYVLHARAIDRLTNHSLEAESEFIIKVQDVNDNAPTFPDGPFSATVPEMSDIGTSVFQVTASDADDPTYGNSAKIVYSILEGQPYFSVDPKSGIIRTAMSNMDRETRDHYTVVIQAKDMAGSVGGLSGSTTVNITLTDVNDNPPKFSQSNYQLYVPELAPVGKAVGRIRASDEDEGQNAEMTYSITNADAAAIFTIITDADHKEGIISLKEPLNYEKRKVHTLSIEGSNTHSDSRFMHLGPFKDSTSLRVIVGDVDEPPVFSMDYYIMDVYENSPAGTQVGTVTAMDPDSTNSAVRYFIENEEEKPLYFTIGVNSGIIRTTQVLDREETAWHNISVMAAEVDNPRMVSHVPVTVQILDINDNVPSISGGNTAVIVCEGTKNGQVIQTIRAADQDNFANGKFSFFVPADHQANPNFTVKNNGDNTASIMSRRREGFSLDRDQEFFTLVVVVTDGGEPPLSSTTTLTLKVCVCQKNTRGRNSNNVCQAQAFLSSAGLSTGAFVAILLCIVILLAIVMLFTQLRNKKTSKEPLILSEEDIRENVVTYDDEGGGEEDTEAFDIAALRNPKGSESHRKFHSYLSCRPIPYGEEEEVEGDEGRIVVVRRRKAQELDYGNYSPESEPAWFVIDCIPREISQSAPSLLIDGHDVIQQIIQKKVAKADSDTRGPPYDSLQTYAYEGCGSLAGSVSSLGLTAAAPELNYADLEDWDPGRQTLEHIVGDQPATGQINPDS
ncbi:cadherin-18-like isoform X2 [Mastacembelus armatus]|uniref:cadherin-18-like isoform X2 n=1 Tax=Mastacembelus armatus TaxID=205130 RepID=UPI000E45CB72|nr:cadherin-18-like isoform X2 [Mastacembelus armatus]